MYPHETCTRGFSHTTIFHYHPGFSKRHSALSIQHSAFSIEYSAFNSTITITTPVQSTVHDCIRSIEAEEEKKRSMLLFRTPRFSFAALFILSRSRNNNSQAFSSTSNSHSNLHSNLNSFRIATTTAIYNNNNNSNKNNLLSTALSMSTSTSTATATSTTVPTWDDLKRSASETPVGKALDRDLELRAKGRGSPNVHSKIRLFGDTENDNDTETNDDESPVFTLYRDHAGWCP